MSVSFTAMSAHSVFLSYASADLAATEALEAWLQTAPRAHQVWRDRRGIPPGAPNYYEPIAQGINDSANVLVHLSVNWLRSGVSARELTDAHASGKKIVVVVHPGIARDPSTPAGRAAKLALFEALSGSSVRALLEPINWIWLVENEGDASRLDPVDLALTTDFHWKRQHAVIAMRLARWETLRDHSALLRGSELAALAQAAFSGDIDRLPLLTTPQRDFLLASQQVDAAERERLHALYSGAQARSLAFASGERLQAEPDLALLLAAESARMADVPEARAALGLALERHAALQRVDHSHGPSRAISGLAFSPNGAWLASADRPTALGDERVAQLRIHEVASGRLVTSVPGGPALGPLAWGERWLAIASHGSIGWMRWDDDRGRFRGNTPTALGIDGVPDFISFSPPGTFSDGERLVWGTRWGDLGVVRVGDHQRQRLTITEVPHGEALTGVVWVGRSRLLCAQQGELVLRDGLSLAPLLTIAKTKRVHSLSARGDLWIACCVTEAGLGLLFGSADQVTHFQRLGSTDRGALACWAGSTADPAVLIGGQLERSGEPLLTLLGNGERRRTLLHGDDQLTRALAAEAHGHWLASGDASGRVWLWNLVRAHPLLRSLTPVPGEPAAVECDRQASPAASAAYTYHLEPEAGGLIQRWVRRPTQAPEAPAELVFTPKDSLGGQHTRVGDQRVVFSDGSDLVFVDVQDTATSTRRAAHNNPVKFLSASSAWVASVACSAENPQQDVLKLWSTDGEPLATITAPESSSHLMITSDGAQLRLRGVSGVLWSMSLALDDWVSCAARMAGRELGAEERLRFRIEPQA